jgi:hypothetical protein
MSAFNQFKDKSAKGFQSLKNEWEDGEWNIGLVIALLLFTGLVALAVKFIFHNIEPYISLVGGSYPTPSNIPIVGMFWDLVSLAYLSFGAFVAWTFINLAELLWLFISLDTKAHRTAIKKAHAEIAAHESSSDGNYSDANTRRLKRKASKIPFFFIEFSPVISLAALTVDFIVNWQRYPVIDSWMKFYGGLLIGKVMGVNWGNLMDLAWNLTSIEVLALLMILIFQWITAHRASD